MAETSEDSSVAICTPSPPPRPSPLDCRDVLPSYWSLSITHMQNRLWRVKEVMGKENSANSSCMSTIHAIHNQGIGGLTSGVGWNPQSILNLLLSLAKPLKEYTPQPHHRSSLYCISCFEKCLVWFPPPEGCIWRILDLKHGNCYNNKMILSFFKKCNQVCGSCLFDHFQ